MKTQKALHHEIRPSRTVSALWVFGALLAMVVMAATAWRASQILAAESHAAAYRDRVSMWAAGTKRYTPEELAEAEQDLRMALQVRPHDGGTHDTLGALHTMRAVQNWDSLPVRERWLGAAKSEYLASAKLRPFLPQAQANLALVSHMLGEPTSEVFGYWGKALSLGPHEKETRILLLNVSLGRWDDAPPMAKQWVERLKKSNVYSEKVWQRWEAYYQIN